MFKILNDILYTKKGTLLDDVDNESEFNGYMINRWASMYSPHMAQLINLTVNRLYSAFPTKRDNYRFLVGFLPKVKFQRINYIKKKQKDKKEDVDGIDILASNLELSKREIRYYIEQGNIKLPKF